MSASDMRDRKETPDVAALIRATLLLSSRDKIKSTPPARRKPPLQRSAAVTKCVVVANQRGMAVKRREPKGEATCC